MDHQAKLQRIKHPKDTANSLSQIFFIYAIKLLKKGYNTPFTEDDLYEAPQNLKSQKLHTNFDNNNGVFRKNFLKCFGLCFFSLGLMKLLADTIFIITEPYLLEKVLYYLKRDYFTAVFYLVVMTLFKLLNCVFTHNFYLYLAGFCLKVRTTLCSLLYKQILAANMKEEGALLGSVVTLFTKNVQIIDNFIKYGNELWITFIKLAIVSYLLHLKIGPVILPLTAFILMVLPVHGLIGENISFFKKQMFEETARRVRISKDTLLKIKNLTSEESLLSKLLDTRKQEVDTIHKIFHLKAFGFTVGHLTLRATVYVLILAYFCLGYNFEIKALVFVLSYVSMLSESLTTMFPQAVYSASELLAMLRKYEEVFEELKPQESNETLFVEENLTRAWTQPWIFFSTFRQNIIFGQQFDEGRYNEVLEVCELLEDVEHLENRDLAMVADDGMNLSRSLKCKIHFARTLYKQKGEYFWGANLQKAIFDNCASSKRSDSGSNDHLLTNQNINRKLVMIDLDEYESKSRNSKCQSYKKYLSLAGGYAMLMTVFSSFVMLEIEDTYTNNLLTFETNMTNYRENTKRRVWFQTYGLMCLLFGATFLVKFLVLFNFAKNCSLRLHKTLIRNILQSSMDFFKNNSTRSFINRFFKDLDAVDDVIPFLFGDLLQICLQILEIVIAVAYMNALYLVPTSALFVSFLVLRQWALNSLRSLKTLEATTVSPIIGYFNATISGVSTISVFNMKDKLWEEFHRHLNLHTSASYTLQCTLKAFALLQDLVVIVYTVVIIISFLLTNQKFESVTVLQIILLALWLKSGFYKWTELDIQMVSFERLLKYEKCSVYDNEVRMKETERPTRTSFDNKCFVGDGTSRKETLVDL